MENRLRPLAADEGGVSRSWTHPSGGARDCRSWQVEPVEQAAGLGTLMELRASDLPRRSVI